MLGIGIPEILILLTLGVLLIGVPVGIVCLVLYLVRRGDGSRVAELEAENRRLREQLDKK